MNGLLVPSVRATLVPGFDLILLLLGAVGASAYWRMASTREVQKSLHEDDFADVSDIQDVFANLSENRSDLLRMLLTQRPEREAPQRTILEHSSATSEKMRECQARSCDDAQVKAVLDELDRLRQEYGKVREQEVIPLINRGPDRSGGPAGDCCTGRARRQNRGNHQASAEHDQKQGGSRCGPCRARGRA